MHFPKPRSKDFHRNRHAFYLFLSVEDLALLVLGLPQPLLLEVGVRQGLGELDAGDVHLCVGGDDKLLVSSAQWHSVDGQGACKNRDA